MFLKQLMGEDALFKKRFSSSLSSYGCKPTFWGKKNPTISQFRLTPERLDPVTTQVPNTAQPEENNAINIQQNESRCISYTQGSSHCKDETLEGTRWKSRTGEGLKSMSVPI